MNTRIYGIVGDGKVASHMKRYFDMLNIEYRSWSRTGSPGVSPEAALENAAVTLLLISDKSIEPFHKQHPDLNAVHFSGSLSLDGVPGYHPLMTFTSESKSLEAYSGIPFISSKEDPPFAEQFPELPNPSYTIDAADKPLYHALCVLSGNFSSLLWKYTFEQFEQRLGMQKEVLLPYMEEVHNNLKKGFGRSLSGPLIRGDKETMERNLDALEGSGADRLYEAFIDMFRGAAV
jgi:hypothetical protein